MQIALSRRHGASIDAHMALVAHHKAAVADKPSKGPLDDPALAVLLRVGLRRAAPAGGLLTRRTIMVIPPRVEAFTRLPTAVPW